MANHARIDRVLRLIHKTGIGTMARGFVGGQGAILMFHHVRPYQRKRFDPNRGLEIEPAFLDALLNHCRDQGYDIIPLGDVPARLAASSRRRFLCLTFDDGYINNLVHALPILQRHQAPFTLFVTTGFADHACPLWWEDIADLLTPDHIVTLEGQSFDLHQPQQRELAYDALMTWFTSGPSDQRVIALNALMRAHGVEPTDHTRRHCLDWRQLADLIDEPLCTFGAHTLTHPLLATLSPEAAIQELNQSKSILEKWLGRSVDQIAYPVGSKAAAGQREFMLAQQAGYRIGVTTRSGMIFDAHAQSLLSLPRLSVNGYHQSMEATSALLSGLPFLMANKGRRVVSA